MNWPYVFHFDRSEAPSDVLPRVLADIWLAGIGGKWRSVLYLARFVPSLLRQCSSALPLEDVTNDLHSAVRVYVAACVECEVPSRIMPWLKAVVASGVLDPGFLAHIYAQLEKCLPVIGDVEARPSPRRLLLAARACARLGAHRRAKSLRRRSNRASRKLAQTRTAYRIIWFLIWPNGSDSGDGPEQLLP